MLLSDLLQQAPASKGADPEISGVAVHSAEVQPGDLFVALKGSQVDGAAYFQQAIANGAAAILAAASLPAPAGTPVVVDVNPRRRLAFLTARFYDTQPQNIAAVTGTNGKTSVAWFTRLIWETLGVPAASLGTLGVVTEGARFALNHTTPQPLEMHRTLAELAADGINYAVVEASSHGLDQHRLDGVRIVSAAFTNFSRDHFDYHQTVEEYFAAKMRLFRDILEPGSTAVLNADSRHYPQVLDICRAAGHEVLSYGRHGAHLRMISHRSNRWCQYVGLEAGGERRTIRLPLVGEFQAWNALCALGLVVACGVKLDEALGTLDCLRGVPGRIQEVAELNGGRVFVDYAHTPDALECCLRALRPHARNHLAVVFGCGGDRDQGKRPAMGRIACAFADRVIVTDDNPRNENPAKIRDEVLAGCERAVEVAGRSQAIETAVAGLGEGDILLIAGKGHENRQIIGGEVLMFDDAQAAGEAAQKFTEMSS